MRPKTLATWKENVGGFACVVVDAHTYGALTDTEITEQGRRKRILQIMNKVAEYSKTFHVDLQKKMVKKLLVNSMDKICTRALIFAASGGIASSGLCP